MVDGQVKPFCIDIGYQRMFRANKKNSFAYSQSISQNYRLPTLNERYWQPGGNPYILPEISKSVEGTAKYIYTRNQIQNVFSATGYYNDISNWIQWVPGSAGFWEVRNTAQVTTKGVELNNEFNYTQRQNIYTLRFNYSYNLSTNKNTEKQLIYTPFNIINLSALVKYKDWVFTANMHYTGFRFTSTDNLNWMPAYQLTNVSVQRAVKIKRINYTFSLLANNIFNTSYQTVENFAMPGRSFLFKLQLNK
ncbi:MAG: TonB-dependent receptor [Bacteroidetes bacterium]|nr:TonB-dependent receptor [Bacteroidota bacterium]